MDQSERNKSGGTVSAGAALLGAIGRALETPFCPPGLRGEDGLLSLLRRYVINNEARLSALEAASHELPAPMRARLDHLLSVAWTEGHMEPPISDAERPGGALPGDVFTLVDALKESAVDRMGGKLE